MLSSTKRRWASGSGLLSASSLVGLAGLADAFSFNIDNTPTQCQNLSISITGSGGTPPYRALVVPFGQTPLDNNIEARKIIDQAFDGDSTSVSFQLNYPALSQFVLVVSDSSDFGTGGTSSAASVVNSSDSSCYDSTTSVQSDFVYNTVPLNQVVSCTSSRLWWDPDDIQGNVRFYGVIPGGDSFNITVQNVTQQTDEGTGFNWTPSIRGGTTLILGAGDDRGLGAGGSVTYIVSQSSSGDTSCLNSESPSSTAGSPAGGSYPTSTQEAENSGKLSSGSTNVGAIVGGVVAGVVVICAFILALLFLRRRRRNAALRKDRTDLFTDNERPGDARQAEMEHLAPPEPYIVPSESAQPSSTSEYGGASTTTGIPDSAYGYGVGTGAGGRHTNRQSQHSLLTSTDAGELAYGRPGTPGTSAGASMATSRKGGGPPVLRPVNIIQYEDAGPAESERRSGEGEEEPETVELPPAYTNIRQV